ncbi:hypothetical protein BT96DRAFT_1007446 [Gymnopus androsaceus JB14]|uniref:Uncharacterized protein n=1 Tax=Gymnopus androsaceus JB14 TaxID=1447944 RepID=A0A6A4GIE9_9AGAR|nr:hypothetical protein BT96DRAFT_1007446 [Gymnopus androsaceus JB14]
MSADVMEGVSQLSIGGGSAFNTVTPLSDEETSQLFPDKVAGSGDDAASTNDAASESFSLYSTPTTTGGRSATTFPTAKKWLTAWLRAVDLARCTISLTPIAPTRANQMAHIMLPQSAPTKAVRQLSYMIAYRDPLPGETDRSGVRNAVRSDIHSLVDMHRVLFLPSKKTLNIITKYLSRAHVRGEWSKLRNGSLEGFADLKDGVIHEYMLLCSPHFKDQHALNYGELGLFPRPYHNFPLIKTHVTPFAIFFHALRVLECPFSPTKVELSVFRNVRLTCDQDMLRHLLECALLGIGTGDPKGSLPTEKVEVITAFMDAVQAWVSRCAVAENMLNHAPSQSSKSKSSRRGSIGETSQHSHSRSPINQPSTPTRSSRTASHPSSSTPAGQVRAGYIAAQSFACETSPPGINPPNATMQVLHGALSSCSGIITRDGKLHRMKPSFKFNHWWKWRRSKDMHLIPASSSTALMKNLE